MHRRSFTSCGAGFSAIYTHGTISSNANNPDAAVLLPCGNGATLVSPKYVERLNLSTEDDVTSAVALAPQALYVFVTGRSGFAVLKPRKDTEGRLHRTFRPFENSVVSHASFDSSGGLLALAAASGNVRVYDCDALHVTHSFPLRQNVLITSLRFHPDTTAMHLFVGTEDGLIYCFDLATRSKKPVFAVKHHVSAVVGLALTHSGKRLVAVSRDKIISISNSRNGQNYHLVVADEPLIGVESLSEMKERVVTVGERGVMRVWDVQNGTELVEAAARVPLFQSLSGGKDEREEREDEDITGVTDVNVTGFVQSGQKELTISLSDQSIVIAELEDDGRLMPKRAFCGNLEQVNDVKVLALQNSRPSITSRDIFSTEQSVDHPSIDVIVATNSNVVWVMDPPAHAFDKSTLESDKAPIDGSTTNFSIAHEDDKLSTQSWTSKQYLYGHRGIVMAIDVVPVSKKCGFVDGARQPITAVAATASADKSARIWSRDNQGSWTCIATAQGHTEAITAIGLSPSTEPSSFYVVTGANDRTIKLWQLHRAFLKRDAADDEIKDEEFATLDDHPLLRARSFMPESLRWLDSESHGRHGPHRALELTAQWTMLAHEKDINTLAISPDSKFIGTGSQDKTVKIWEAETGVLKITCRGHKRGIFDVRFSPVDKIIASSSGDCSVRIWDVMSGRCLRTLEGHAAGVLKVGFISMGMQIVSSGMDGLLKIWTVRTGECDDTIDAHEDSIWALDTLRDGDFLISGGMDGRVNVWADQTKRIAQESAEKKDKTSLLKQRINDALLHRKWIAAADSALELEMPRNLKSTFVKIVTTSADADEEIKNVVAALRESKDGKAKIARLLSYCRDWNAVGGASSAAVAAYVLHSVFSLWSPSVLCDELGLSSRGLVEALVAHNDRHHARVAGLATKVYFLDYTLTAMRGLGDLRNDGVVVDKNASPIVPSKSERIARLRNQEPMKKRRIEDIGDTEVF